MTSDDNQPDNNEALLNALDPEIIERFKRAIETGKWPDGRALTDEQRKTCMQAVILYEHANVPEDQRTGYVPPKPTACGDDPEPLTWK